MRRSKRSTIVFFVFIALLTAFLFAATGCIHKTGGTVTPWERVHTYNAALADANNTLEKGVETAAGLTLLTPQQARALVQWSLQVAALHQQITAILAQGSASTDNRGIDIIPDVSKATALIDQIKASLLTLPPDALGIRNPNSQQMFRADVANIGTLADALLSALEAVTSSGSSALYFPIGMPFVFCLALSPQALEEIIGLIVQLGPLAVDLFVKLESLLNLGPDAKKNILNAIAASNAADQETINRAAAYMKANPGT